MSDITVNLKLNEDASSKLKNIASAGEAAGKQLSNAGKQMDNAFRSSSLDRFSSKLGQAISEALDQVKSLGDALDEIFQTSEDQVKFGVSFDDSAVSSLGDIEDRASALDGTSVNVGVAADDSATEVVNAVEDSVSNLDGLSASTELGAEDNASQIVDAASDKISGFDGEEGTAEIGVDDSASQVVDSAADKVSGFDGESGTADIGANDNASSIIDMLFDKARSWAGSAWNAVLGVEVPPLSSLSDLGDNSILNGLTAPITSVIDAAKNPIAQAGAALGIGFGINEALSTHMDFEATMSKVQALANATDADMVRLSETAKQMGADTKYSGNESAEAFTYMAQAGWDTQSMIDGIGGIMSLAASDGISLAGATDIVASALSAFGMEAKESAQFADVMAVAASATQTDVTNLGEAFKYVAPVAGAMKYDVQDVSLALGMMSNQAINGSQAGTTLRSALTNLAKPTDDMQAAMDKYGISLVDSQGNMKSLRGVMDNLRSGLGDLSESEQMATAATLFGKEAMTGMLAIVNTSEEDYQSLAEQIDNSAGAADRMAEIMQDNLAGTLEELGGKFETMNNNWGERMDPYVRDIANAISSVLPSVEAAGMQVFDYLDEKVDHFKSRLSGMMSTDEWQESNLLGKIDIAWNELIVEPFLGWAGSEGKSLVSQGINSLFTEAGKILPGGEEAGIASWLSAGLLAKGSTSMLGKIGTLAQTLSPIGNAIKGIGTAAKSASSIGGFISNLGKMVPTAAKFGIAAAAITTAVVGIGTAIDSYNQKVISDNLEKHFGSIELDESQIEDFASRVIDAEWLVNINAAVDHFSNAEELTEQAEEALSSNDSLEWKARVGIELTEDEQSSYLTNIQTFTDGIEQSLSEQTLAAKLVVDEFDIKAADGSSLGSKIAEWAEADMQEVSRLSAGLTNLVQNALTDGIIDVDEQAAIDQLQSKISNIMSGWQEAEAQAEMDMLTQKYGRLSGKDLTDGTFLKLVEEMENQRETAMAALEEDEKELYTTLNALNRKDENGIQRISDSELAYYKQQAGYASRNSEASMLAEEVNFEMNTLSDAYGEKLSQNYNQIQSDTESLLSDANTMLQNQDYASLADSLRYGFGSAMTGTSIFSDEDQGALSQIYDAMKPNFDSMAGIIDEYRAMGQAVPQDIMDSFNSAMLLGAASGDADAAWQVFANEMVADPANEALVQAIQDGTVNVPEELQTAIDRATTETTLDPITIEGLQAELEEIEVNQEHVGELLDAAFEGLEATGETREINGTLVTEYEVMAGQTMSEIAAQAGIALDELIALNPDIKNPNIINMGQKVYIPASAVDVDASGVGQAADEAIQSESGGETTFDKTVTQNTTYVEGERDTSQVDEASQEAATAEPTETTVPTSINFIVSEINDSELAGAMTDYLAAQPAVPVTVPVVVTAEMAGDNFGAVSGEFYTGLDSGIQAAFGSAFQPSANVAANMGSDNFSETASAFANRFQSALTSAFAKTFTATTNASITVNYSIANPTKTITFSGGGTGTATVYAHASGGIFEEPHYGLVAEAGPEAIIPLDGSGNALDLWAEAGQRLGVLEEAAITTSPYDMPQKSDTAAGGVENGTSKEINLNINGSGKIQVGDGVSKEDVLQILIENVKGVLMGMLQDEILTEGDGVYEY